MGPRGGRAAGPGWPLGTSFAEGQTTPDGRTHTHSQSPAWPPRQPRPPLCVSTGKVGLRCSRGLGWRSQW